MGTKKWYWLIEYVLLRIRPFEFFGISYLGALPGIISTVSLAHYTTMASGWVSKGAAMYWTATVKTFFAEDEAFSILKSGDEVNKKH